MSDDVLLPDKAAQQAVKEHGASIHRGGADPKSGAQPQPDQAAPFVPTAALPAPQQPQIINANAPLALPAQPSLVQPSDLAHDDRWQTSRLIEGGRKLFLEGKVIEARRRFVAALRTTSPEATLSLARSFDTFYLSRLSISDGAPDMQRALKLYATAVESGSQEGVRDLARVQAALESQVAPMPGPAPSPLQQVPPQR